MQTIIIIIAVMATTNHNHIRMQIWLHFLLLCILHINQVVHHQEMPIIIIIIIIIVNTTNNNNLLKKITF